MSPLTLQGKLLYREACNTKLASDLQLPSDLTRKWARWENDLPERVTVPRTLSKFREEIEAVELHSFGDASAKGVYAVVTQKTGISRGIVAGKARLAKQGLTIPRLELVAAHMATNLVWNVQEALKGFPVTSVHGWLDSTVALHWIKGGEYKQFVANRVRKIQAHPHIQWHHVPTDQNPADVGSRGGTVTGNNLWWDGLNWLAEPGSWPPNIVTADTPETKAEARATQELFAATVGTKDGFDHLLAKFSLRKVLRVGAREDQRLLGHEPNPMAVQPEPGPVRTHYHRSLTVPSQRLEPSLRPREHE